MKNVKKINVIEKNIKKHIQKIFKKRDFENENAKIRTKTLKDDKKVLVLGISGGADSVALLHMLYSLKKKYKWKLIVAHVNHQLRGKESDLDAEFVKNLARKMNLPYEEKTVDLKKYALGKIISKNSNSKKHTLKKLTQKQNLEEAGRELRYDFFNSLRKKHKADWIVLAHHANDNIETMIMNLMRGASVTGLKGMSFARKNILRPFISVKKKEILDYIKKNKLSFREDQTNFDATFTRNYIRWEILPRLAKIQPKYETLLMREQRYFKELDDFLKKISHKWLESNIEPMNHKGISEKFNFENKNTKIRTKTLKNDEFRGHGSGLSEAREEWGEKGVSEKNTAKKMDTIIIKQESFLDIDFFLQKEILKRIFIKMRGSTKGLSQKQIHEVMMLIKKGKTGKKKLFGSCAVDLSYGFISFQKNLKKNADNKKISKNSFFYHENTCNVIKKTQLLIPGKTIIETSKKCYFDEKNIIIETKLLSPAPLREKDISKKMYRKGIIYLDFDRIKKNIWIRSWKPGDKIKPLGLTGSKKIQNIFVDKKIPRNQRKKIPIFISASEKIIAIGNFMIHDEFKITPKTKHILELLIV
ncbi:tRNA lysidine(34) synthetase TilS [Candidatus Peregrinibacteria bacterium]|nr:tRNA lysidine(34) synthetase TilS [Candidatus Peregrinibacteria bacterium]